MIMEMMSCSSARRIKPSSTSQGGGRERMDYLNSHHAHTAEELDVRRYLRWCKGTTPVKKVGKFILQLI